jgi:hypothetical protein
MQRVAPTPAVTKVGRGDVKPKPRVSFCLQAGGTIAPPPPSASIRLSRPRTIEPRQRRQRRRWMLAAASVAVSVALIAGLLIWLTKWTPSGAQAAPTPHPTPIMYDGDDASAAAASSIDPPDQSFIEISPFEARTPGVLASPADDQPVAAVY